MTIKTSSSAVALGAGLLLALSACSAEPGGDELAPIDGQWRMTSLEAGGEGNYLEVPYSGQVIFDGELFSVQASNPDVAAPDTSYTVSGYEAYYGLVDVDEDEGSFTVEVENALARDLVGQTLERRFEVDGDTLVLTPADPSEGWRVTYERSNAE